MDYITLIGLVAACLTTGALVPQLLKTWRSRSTEDLSLGMFSMLFTGTVLWLIYGLLTRDIPVIFANGLACLFSFVILFFKLQGIIQRRKSVEKL